MIWVLPGVAAVLLALPVVLALRRCTAETAALRQSLSALAEVAPLVRELQSDVVALRADVPGVVRRRPALPPAS